MSRYGLGDPDWFTPPSPDYRVGRRPAGRLDVAERARELLQEVLTKWVILSRPG